MKEDGYKSGRCLKHMDLIQANKDAIEKLTANQEEDKSDIRKIKEQLEALGNGGFRKMVMEQNKKLIEEFLKRDDKEREYNIQKWKVIAGVLGGSSVVALIQLIAKML
ncbi:hypothetical protein [Orenia marismortui]|uniref:hypothetical protein n=1 Tax=Orenia marismortui TaxID=46469 RepID=UPI00037FF7AF|nr:hypothetical protein [Orenia marismortui]